MGPWHLTLTEMRIRAYKYHWTGVGGLVDFMLGAACSSDGLGKPIVAMTSVTPSGESKIVPQFKPGALQHYSLDIKPQGVTVWAT